MLLDKKEFKIMEEFSNDYSKRIYGRAISKKLKMNQKTVSNILNKLEKENILKFSKEGKNKYYFLNKFNSNINDIIKLIEINKKIKFLEKHEKIRNLFDELEKRTNGIAVIFGSYAKSQETEKSDLDLFMIGTIENIKDLEDMYNIKINVVKAKKENLNKDYMLNEIIKNHIILKGIEDFILLIKW